MPVPSRRVRMVKLFSALDIYDAICFVDEVERGAACGCLCPVCRSPLIAKQGDVRDWHFAHEANQERPECETGALNMLRRLAAEHVRAQECLLLPRYVQQLAVRSARHVLREEVSWGAKFSGAIDWLPIGPKGAPLATGRLDSGCDADLYVEIGDERPRIVQMPLADRAQIVFWCPAPTPSQVRARNGAQRFVQEEGRFYWRSHPDTKGLVQAARARLEAASLIEDDRAGQWRAPEQQTKPSAPHGETGSVLSAPIKAPHAFALGRKPNTGLSFYRLKDGQAWVVYTVEDGSHAVAPWPRPEDGWDEALPPSVGIPDPELPIYRVSTLVGALTYLGSNSVKVRTGSNPADFEGY